MEVYAEQKIIQLFQKSYILFIFIKLSDDRHSATLYLPRHTSFSYYAVTSVWDGTYVIIRFMYSYELYYLYALLLGALRDSPFIPSSVFFSGFSLEKNKHKLNLIFLTFLAQQHS